MTLSLWRSSHINWFTFSTKARGSIFRSCKGKTWNNEFSSTTNSCFVEIFLISSVEVKGTGIFNFFHFLSSVFEICLSCLVGLCCKDFFIKYQSMLFNVYLICIFNIFIFLSISPFSNVSLFNAFFSVIFLEYQKCLAHQRYELEKKIIWEKFKTFLVCYKV